MMKFLQGDPDNGAPRCSHGSASELQAARRAARAGGTGTTGRPGWAWEDRPCALLRAPKMLSPPSPAPRFPVCTYLVSAEMKSRSIAPTHSEPHPAGSGDSQRRGPPSPVVSPPSLQSCADVGRHTVSETEPPPGGSQRLARFPTCHSSRARGPAPEQSREASPDTPPSSVISGRRQDTRTGPGDPDRRKGHRRTDLNPKSAVRLRRALGKNSSCFSSSPGQF